MCLQVDGDFLEDRIREADDPDGNARDHVEGKQENAAQARRTDVTGTQDVVVVRPGRSTG